jgi:hypothetical protein
MGARIWALEKAMAPAVRPHPEARPAGNEVLMAQSSLACSAQEESAEVVECFRHEGEECPRCDGSGDRPRKYCARCGEPSGKPSEGGRALMGLKNRRDKDQPMWCLHCHPEHHFVDAVWSCLERMGG